MTLQLWAGSGRTRYVPVPPVWGARTHDLAPLSYGYTFSQGVIMNILLEAIVLAVGVHFLYDFHLQGPWIAENKGNSKFLLVIHALTWAILVWIPIYLLVGQSLVTFVVLFVSHLIIDSWNSKAFKKSFHYIYYDQTLHIFSIIGAVMATFFCPIYYIADIVAILVMMAFLSLGGFCIGKIVAKNEISRSMDNIERAVVAEIGTMYSRWFGEHSVIKDCDDALCRGLALPAYRYVKSIVQRMCDGS